MIQIFMCVQGIMLIQEQMLFYGEKGFLLEIRYLTLFRAKVTCFYTRILDNIIFILVAHGATKLKEVKIRGGKNVTLSKVNSVSATICNFFDFKL